MNAIDVVSDGLKKIEQMDSFVERVTIREDS